MARSIEIADWHIPARDRASNRIVSARPRKCPRCAVADQENFGHALGSDYTRRSGSDHASQTPMPVNAATVAKAARKAWPISA